MCLLTSKTLKVFMFLVPKAVTCPFLSTRCRGCRCAAPEQIKELKAIRLEGNVVLKKRRNDENKAMNFRAGGSVATDGPSRRSDGCG